MCPCRWSAYKRLGALHIQVGGITLAIGTVWYGCVALHLLFLQSAFKAHSAVAREVFPGQNKGSDRTVHGRLKTMHHTRITSATVNGIQVTDSDDCPKTLRCPVSDYSGPDSGFDGPDVYSDREPITQRNPSLFRSAPCFDHWSDVETCAPSSGGLCSVSC